MKTRLLVSARNLAEARVALSAGAHIIDLKEPAQGALGAVSADILREVVTDVDGRRPVSATVGDLPMHPSTLCQAVARTAACGPDFVKIGFFRSNDARWRACTDALESHANDGLSLVAVLFADQDPDLTCLEWFAHRGFRGVMVDTAAKHAGPLTRYWHPRRLAAFVSQVRNLGMMAGLAGSLALAQIPELVRLDPDYLGFRGALCDQEGRTGMLQADRITEALRGLSQAACTIHPQHHRASAWATLGET